MLMEIRANSSSQAKADAFGSSARVKKQNSICPASKEPPGHPEVTKIVIHSTRSLFRHESVLPCLTYCLGKRKDALGLKRPEKERGEHLMKESVEGKKHSLPEPPRRRARVENVERASRVLKERERRTSRDKRSMLNFIVPLPLTSKPLRSIHFDGFAQQIRPEFFWL